MKRFLKIGLLVALVAAFASCTPPTAPLSSDKAIVSYMFEQAKNPTVLTTDYNATYNEISGKWAIGPLPAFTDVRSLVATFALSEGASMDLGGVAQVSGTTANDFSGDVAYTITAADGTTATATVSVSVTVPSSNCALTAYSLSCDGVSYAGSIDETAKTITVRLPSGSDVSAAVATFTKSTNASVVIGSTAQVSGTTTNNFSSAIEYVVTAQDGATSATYTVTAAVNPDAPIQVIGFVADSSSYYADGAGAWIDLLVVDADALVSGWALKASGYASNAGTDNLLFASTSIPAGWILADGDVIRIHSSAYTGASDATSKADDTVNTGIWDYKIATSTFAYTTYGVIYVQDAATAASIVDIVAYTCDKNNNYWVSGAALAPLTQAVAEMQWLSADYADAFDIGNSVLCAANLLDSVQATRDGNKAADWESDEPTEILAVLATTLSTQAIQGSVGGSTVIATEIYALGGATVSSVTADLSAIGGTGSDALASDGAFLYTRTVNVATGTTVGNYPITVTITDGDGNTVSDSTMLRITSGAPIVMAFPDSDMEDTMHNTSFGLKPSGTAYASVTGHDGSTTQALHVSGTADGSNGYVFSSALPMNAKGDYTKVTFWIKGSSTGKGLSIQIDSSGQCWPLPAINNATPDPIAMATAHSYTTPIVADAGTENNGWFKVTLDLGAATISDTSIFSLKYGKTTGVYDIYIDEIAYE